jgi:hypothetical protein
MPANNWCMFENLSKVKNPTAVHELYVSNLNLKPGLKALVIISLKESAGCLSNL